jgi:hypothetical protein
VGKINVGRWLAGGIVAGIIVWLLEGVGAMLYMSDVESALEAHGLAMDMSVGMGLITVVISLLVGLTLVFFYAAARPHFGPGPKTAIIVAVALWFGGYMINIIGYGMIRLYPTGMLAIWSVQGLVELSLASLVGGWIYREE